MDNRQVFIAVVEENSFTSAAARLESTPAVISRRVKTLEASLGVRLLQRTTRSLKLTPAGEVYFKEVKGILDQLTSLEQTLTEQTGELSGEIKMAAPMSFGQVRVAPLMAGFSQLYPNLKVSLILDDHQSKIIDEGYDLAIRISYPQDTSLIGKKVADIASYACASPEYLSTNGTPGLPTDLCKHRCLHYNLISEREEWTFYQDKAEQVIPVSSYFCSNNGDVLMQAAIDGMGIVYLPDFIVESALKDGQLVRILKGFEKPPLSLYLLYPSRSHLPQKIRKMIDYLSSQLA